MHLMIDIWWALWNKGVYKMFEDKLMARLCVNAPYMIFFLVIVLWKIELWSEYINPILQWTSFIFTWSYEMNILAPPHKGQVVYLLDDILTPPGSGQVICSPSGKWSMILYRPHLAVGKCVLTYGNTSGPPHSGQVVYSSIWLGEALVMRALVTP